jgi:hypothetical protein
LQFDKWSKMHFTYTVNFWVDTEKKQYKTHAAITISAPDTNEPAEQPQGTVLFTPEMSVQWKTEYGSIQDVKKRKSVITDGKPNDKEGMMSQMMLELFFVDALFGYPDLKNHAMLIPTDSPLPDKDDLQWFELKDIPKEGEEDSPFREALWADGDVDSILAGFSPDTGWPMALLFKGKRLSGTLRVTAIDLKPDLTGVFDLPPEVKAKMADPAAQP